MKIKVNNKEVGGVAGTVMGYVVLLFVGVIFFFIVLLFLSPLLIPILVGVLIGKAL